MSRAKRSAHLTVIPAANPKMASENSSTAGRRKLMDVQPYSSFCPLAAASSRSAAA
jgi:hypothetical protein